MSDSSRCALADLTSLPITAKNITNKDVLLEVFDNLLIPYEAMEVGEIIGQGKHIIVPLLEYLHPIKCP